jgi:hypothetical protein
MVILSTEYSVNKLPEHFNLPFQERNKPVKFFIHCCFLSSYVAILEKYNTGSSLIINENDCPIAVGVENPHKFWMCRQPHNVRQTSRPISTTAGSATYRRY